MVLHTVPILLGFLIMFLSTTSAADFDDTSCSGNLLTVVASIVRIEPAGHMILSGNRQVGVGQCFRGGEILSLGKSKDGPHKAVLFMHGKFIHVTRDPPLNGTYRIPEGLGSVSDAVWYRVQHMLSLIGAVPAPPPQPIPTASPRGNADSGEESNQYSSSTKPLRNIQTLRNLPRQQVAPGSTIVLSWRNGQGPWRCQGLSAHGEVIVDSQLVSTGSCEVRLGERIPSRIVVHDARGEKIGWNVTAISSKDVPRPEWIQTRENNLTAAQRTAWAIWIWKEATPDWKLQALSMLNQAAEESWLAGYVLNSILADFPIVHEGPS